MITLRTILIGIGIIIGILIVGGIQDFWSDRGLLALFISFLAVVVCLWTIAYAGSNEVHK